MKSKQEQEDYIKVFLVFCSGVELWMKRIVVILLALLILAQGALCIPEIRNLVSSAARLEGVRVSP